jgi:broad specificity polyphosphatase/5'/3'-nucleotidase SurE
VPTISTGGAFTGDILPIPAIATSYRLRHSRKQLITKSACCKLEVLSLRQGEAFSFGDIEAANLKLVMESFKEWNVNTPRTPFASMHDP